ncbi:hypothetical protein DPMN_074700 [Dreissena polymorpha]|uniref:Uncharacterized protein n=1 Tax=Dreissena polymorpha TaxID=45954 RepID=A0A9D4BLT7_DREPO|nr:hypothetical protein DPMN_074700 [Dreissena polymorpha]
MGVFSCCELQDLTDRLYDMTEVYEVDVSTEKSRIIADSMNNTCADITMNGEKLEDVTSFKSFANPAK